MNAFPVGRGKRCNEEKFYNLYTYLSKYQHQPETIGHVDATLELVTCIAAAATLVGQAAAARCLVVTMSSMASEQKSKKCN